MSPLCICNGVIRSGSTWSFNVCREIFQEQAIRMGRPFESTYLDSLPLEQYITNQWPRSSAVSVIKAHGLGANAMTTIRRGAAKAVCTYRDPRDCVASDLAFMEYPLEISIKRISMTLEPLRAYQATPHILMVRYEDMMADRLREIQKIARHLGVSLDDATVRRIDVRTNMQSSERVCKNMKHRPGGLMNVAGHRVDPSTHLHENHINGGTVGRWRYELSEEQGAYVTEFFAPWLLQLGYETPQSLQAIVNTTGYTGNPTVPMQQVLMPQAPMPQAPMAGNRIGTFSVGGAMMV